MTGLDRWILDEFSQLEQEVIAAYDQYEFHVVYQKVSQFVAVELSAIYHDVVKDRLYTDPANSPRRRSTQTALHRMVASLCQDARADSGLHRGRGLGVCARARRLTRRTSSPGSRSDSSGPKRSGPPGRLCLSCANWRCRSWRRPGRRKQIGKALEAKLTFAGSSPALTAAQAHLESLRELLNVSQLEIQPGGEGAVDVSVSKAAGQKCERCWHWETDVGSHPEHPTICARCVKAVQEGTRA